MPLGELKACDEKPIFTAITRKLHNPHNPKPELAPTFAKNTQTRNLVEIATRIFLISHLNFLIFSEKRHAMETMIMLCIGTCIVDRRLGKENNATTLLFPPHHADLLCCDDEK